MDQSGRVMLRRLLEEMDGSLDLVLCPPSEETSWWRRLHQLADEASGAARPGVIRVVEDRDADLPARPGMLLVTRHRRNIAYLALPEGPEAEPFHEALAWLLRRRLEPEPVWAGALAVLNADCSILVFVAPGCPSCPHMVRAAIQLAVVTPLVRVAIVDALEHSDLAQRYGVRTVPLTVVDDELSITGVLPAAELAARVLERGAAGHRGRVFASLLEAGRHDAAARLVLDAEAAPYVLEHWKHSTLAVRLGLMIVAEAVLESDPHALDGLVPELIAVLRSADASVRGDTVDLLGRIGHDAARPPIEGMRRDPHPHVAEIAAEVLEEMDERARRSSR